MRIGLYLIILCSLLGGWGCNESDSSVVSSHEGEKPISTYFQSKDTTQKPYPHIVYGIDTIIYFNGQGLQTKVSLDTVQIPASTMPSIVVLQTGVFSGDDIQDQWSKEIWVGLFKREDNSYYLKTTPVAIKTINAEIDSSYGLVEKEVSCPNNDSDFILIAGFPRFFEGAVDAADVKFNTPVNASDTIDFNFKATHYIIRASGERFGPENTFNYKLYLSCVKNGRRSEQLILAAPRADYVATINWAGDMDGDGKLDLIIGFSPTDYTSRIAVYLSSNADMNNLVKYIGALFMVDNC